MGQEDPRALQGGVAGKGDGVTLFEDLLLYWARRRQAVL